MLGYEVGELIGQYSHAIWHHSKTDGSPYPAEECPIYAAYKDGSVHHMRNEVFWKKDGTNFPVEYTSTPILEEEKIAGAVVTFRDISELKRAEEGLRESEEKFRKLASSAQDAIVMLDNEGNFLYWNEAFERMFGYSNREISDKEVHTLIAPERYHENYKKGFAHFRETGE
jgi:PAS domain S-box-containing protein